MIMKHYDYIFTGSGLSALMTVYKMILSEQFKDKKILLLDENLKNKNDRTWCFWENKNSEWSKISSKTWDFALFKNTDFSRTLTLEPYEYLQIRSVDFYTLVFDLISKQDNITFLNEKVTDINELDTHVFVKTETQECSAGRVINSIVNVGAFINQHKYAVIQQHFVGWFVETEEAVFDPNQCTFMDFSVDQKNNTRFMYVLPTSTTEALLEYTLFSKDLLPFAEYEEEIKSYLKNLGVKTFKITEKEQGNIPMTCYPFWEKNTKRVLNIGTAGGWTKASTGYTFKKTDKKSSELIKLFLQQNDYSKLYKKDKFWFYDLLLLDILYRNNALGSSIFSSLFKKGDPNLIFKFLDEETSLWQDFQVILKCPKLPFIKSLFRVAFLPKKFNLKS